MKTGRLFYLVIHLTFFSTMTALGQVVLPPPEGVPAEDNKVLIDKIIEITEHERYFTDYCSNRVKKYAVENKWTQEKTKSILKSIKFEYYNSTIYNSYASYSTEQLNKLFDALQILNMDDPRGALRMVLTNSMMQSNLDVFVDAVIMGKYVTGR